MSSQWTNYYRLIKMSISWMTFPTLPWCSWWALRRAAAPWATCRPTPTDHDRLSAKPNHPKSKHYRDDGGEGEGAHYKWRFLIILPSSTFPRHFLNIPPISTSYQHMPHFINSTKLGSRVRLKASWSSVDFVVGYLPLTCWVVGSFKLSSGYSSW